MSEKPNRAHWRALLCDRIKYQVCAKTLNWVLRHQQGCPTIADKIITTVTFRAFIRNIKCRCTQTEQTDNPHENLFALVCRMIPFGACQICLRITMHKFLISLNAYLMCCYCLVYYSTLQLLSIRVHLSLLHYCRFTHLMHPMCHQMQPWASNWQWAAAQWSPLFYQR